MNINKFTSEEHKAEITYSYEITEVHNENIVKPLSVIDCMGTDLISKLDKKALIYLECACIDHLYDKENN